MTSSHLPTTNATSEVDALGGLQLHERLPLTGAHLNLQSKLYTVSRAINPLVAAAGPLLTMAGQLLQTETAPNLNQLQEQLEHEMRVFESKAQGLGYRAQIVLAARYVLCSVLDELIETTDWGKLENWQEHALLMTFQGETFGGERTFFILDRAAEDPGIYLDLLELGYLCMSLGYEGKYRKIQNGHQELNQWTENLHQMILHHRGEVSKQLLVSPPPQSKKTAAPAPWRLPPWWLSITIAILILAGIYGLYAHHLHALANPIDTVLNQLADK